MLCAPREQCPDGLQRVGIGRVDGCKPSNANSETSDGCTVRTGPCFSSVCSRTKRSISRISASVKPEYALVIGMRVRDDGTGTGTHGST